MPPYFLVKSIGWFRNVLLGLNRKLFPGNVVLYEQFQSLWLLPSLYVAAKLDVAEHLKNGPLTAEELATRCSADPGALARVMRALAAEGIFRRLRDGRFALNGRSRPLLNGEGSLRNMLIHHLGPTNWKNVGELLYTVQTGKEAFTRIYGKDLYSYLKEHPEEYQVFDRSMSNLSELGLAPIASAYNFGKFATIADIGGGEGYLLSAILKKYPAANGILFDLPEALGKAASFLKSQGTSSRIQVMPGNFNEPIRLSADLFILKNIIHNWDDEKAALILSNIAVGMEQGAKILIIDMIVPEHGGSPTPSLLDIQMLVSFSEGKERSRAEFEKVVALSGLKISRIVPTIAPISLIEVYR
jgi:hypothetical protein